MLKSKLESELELELELELTSSVCQLCELQTKSEAAAEAELKVETAEVQERAVLDLDGLDALLRCQLTKHSMPIQAKRYAAEYEYESQSQTQSECESESGVVAGVVNLANIYSFAR
ncbi:hypothetical protein AWZ03_013379 [Drosophila navojoa]|uniref:Uncharacterized protein n=1 Tax=Drosophila navojoa TaxID=7232 RepID=A0A484AUQ7_DRONA|nr:hypothetical protein AWZ03_013379 [Drosophila navojoa]